MGDILVELTRGLSPKKSMTFAPGKPAETFSVGQQGVWSVNGAGVANVHAYLFFDGTTLFVASADPTGNTSVDGKKVTSDWFPLAPPCEVALGETRLKVSGSAGASAGPPSMSQKVIEENPTMAMDPMKAMALMAPQAGAPTPGESTRFQPDGAPAAAAGFPGMMMPGAAPPGVPPPPPPGSAFAKIKYDWENASSSKRLTVLLIPCFLVASYVLFGEDDQVTVTAAPPKPAASASAKVADTATTRPTSAALADAPPIRTAPPGASGAMSAGAVAGAAAGAAAGGAAAAGTGDTTPGGPMKQGKDKDAPKKTTQRMAADAVAGGNYAEALRHYQTLSRENPNDPAFKEAIRILKARSQLARAAARSLPLPPSLLPLFPEDRFAALAVLATRGDP